MASNVAQIKIYPIRNAKVCREEGRTEFTFYLYYSRPYPLPAPTNGFYVPSFSAELWANGDSPPVLDSDLSTPPNLTESTNPTKRFESDLLCETSGKAIYSNRLRTTQNATRLVRIALTLIYPKLMLKLVLTRLRRKVFPEFCVLLI